MSETEILFVKPGALKATDKARLSKAGIVCIEIDNPQGVKFVRAGTEISSTAMLTCAMKAMMDAYEKGAGEAMGLRSHSIRGSTIH